MHVNWYIIVWALHVLSILSICCVGIGFNPVVEYKRAPGMFIWFASCIIAAISLFSIPLTIVVLS